MHHRLLAAMAAALCVIVMAGGAVAHPLYPGLEGYKDQSRHPAYAGKRSEVTADAVAIAKRYLGTNPTQMRRLWCQVFVNLIEKKAGRKGTGSAAAISTARYGKKVSLANARPGDLVVTKRRGGHHVGYLLAKQGKTVRLISGNSGGRGPGKRVVAEGNYSISRIVAVRRPS